MVLPTDCRVFLAEHQLLFEIRGADATVQTGSTLAAAFKAAVVTSNTGDNCQLWHLSYHVNVTPKLACQTEHPSTPSVVNTGRHVNRSLTKPPVPKLCPRLTITASCIASQDLANLMQTDHLSCAHKHFPARCQEP